jgi:hypothetical protein
VKHSIGIVSGTFDEGWLIGNLIGNGSISSTQWGKTALLRYWKLTLKGNGKTCCCFYLKTVDYAGTTESGHYYKQQNYRVIQSTELAKLAASYDVTLDNKMPTRKIEEASYAFYCGFYVVYLMLMAAYKEVNKKELVLDCHKVI